MKVDAVTPLDAVAEWHRHGEVVGAVGGLIRRERIDPFAGVLVDVPQHVHHQALAGRHGWTARNKHVEVVGHAVAEDLVGDVHLLAGDGDWQAPSAEPLSKTHGFEWQHGGAATNG